MKEELERLLTRKCPRFFDSESHRFECRFFVFVLGNERMLSTKLSRLELFFGALYHGVPKSLQPSQESVELLHKLLRWDKKRAESFLFAVSLRPPRRVRDHIIETIAADTSESLHVLRRRLSPFAIHVVESVIQRESQQSASRNDA